MLIQEQKKYGYRLEKGLISFKVQVAHQCYCTSMPLFSLLASICHTHISGKESKRKAEIQTHNERMEYYEIINLHCLIYSQLPVIWRPSISYNWKEFQRKFTIAINLLQEQSCNVCIYVHLPGGSSPRCQ